MNAKLKQWMFAVDFTRNAERGVLEYREGYSLMLFSSGVFRNLVFFCCLDCAVWGGKNIISLLIQTASIGIYVQKMERNFS